MILQAIILDVYGTLLEVGAPEPGVEGRWSELHRRTFGAPAEMTLEELVAKTRGLTVREHEVARAQGIPWPEVSWPKMLGAVLPRLAALPQVEREELAYRVVQLLHATRLTPGAGEVLCELRRRGTVLGIASNAQAYTLRELGEALASVGLDWDLFQSDVCFWSFAHGFSKPDPHVFRWLTTRLEALGLPAGSVVMVGDRADHDLEPARAHGWLVWQAGAPYQERWDAFRRWLDELETGAHG